MADDGIFLIQGGTLHVLKPQPYESEDLLQQALAAFPAVLAGSSTAETGNRELLLVRREMGVPKAEGASAVWSLDHLFIDSQAVPVVVEVKRSSDTRIRREVIGQMIDYAANAVKYWPVQSLRHAFAATAAEDHADADERLRDFLVETEPDEFWRRVSDNLAAGRIRMLFVADHLPEELVRAIEFLNEQMNPAEVLGIEVPQFVGEGHQVLVPRVIGRTSSAVAVKERSGTTWTEATFLNATAETQGDEVVAFFKRLFDHVRKQRGQFSWGRGMGPGVSARYRLGDLPTTVWTGNSGATAKRPRGYIYFWLPEMRAALPTEQFDSLVNDLEDIPSYRAPMQDARSREFKGTYPALLLHDVLGAPGEVDLLFRALDRLLDDGRQLPAPP